MTSQATDTISTVIAGRVFFLMPPLFGARYVCYFRFKDSFTFSASAHDVSAFAIICETENFNKLCEYLSTFKKFLKATISFITSLRPSVRTHGTTRLPLDEFSLRILLKSVDKIPSFIKI